MRNKDMPDVYTADDINPATECRFVLIEDYAAIKKKSERLLREISDAHSKIVDLEAGEEKLKARVAELDALVRDIRQHDIDETAKRILDGGRKFNYLLPLNIRERIATALKEPANEG